MSNNEVADSVPYTNIPKQCLPFFCLLWKGKTIVLGLPLALHTMLQQLQNLASNDIIHGYQTCPLVESFFQEQVLERV